MYDLELSFACHMAQIFVLILYVNFWVLLFVPYELNMLQHFVLSLE